MGYIYVKQNDEPISIEYVSREKNINALFPDLVPSFWFENERHYLDDYVRCHDNPWIGSVGFPEYIHGFDCFDYSDNIKFIEIVDSDHLNVWREVRMEQ